MNSLVASYTAAWRQGASRQTANLRDVPRPELGDLIGGVSVALVLIPQSLAYADLAGLPAFIGLFASALPLLAFCLLASSPYLQTGPVALTSLLTLGALTSAGAIEYTQEYVALAALLAIIVGAIRLALGMLRVGSIVYLMAEPVMIGFTSGAGLVILSSQLPKALGIALPDSVSGWANPIARAAWSVVHPLDWEIESLVMSVITLTLMLGGRSLHKLFPGVLVAVVLALGYSELFDYDGAVVGDVDAGFPPLSFDLPWSRLGDLLVGGLVIALVGFAEPASIARTFANEEHTRWSSSREFVASGLANLTSGVSGGFPVGGSFSRSSINRFAGARTRWSGGVTGLVVLAFLPFADALTALPEAVLGAIVVGAVLSLIRPGRLVRMVRRSPWQAGLAWVTFVATLLTPPQVQYAVLLGVVLTVVFHYTRRFRLEVEETDGEELRLRPRGLLWVGTNGRLADELRSTIDAHAGSGTVTVNLDRTTAIDAAIAEAVAAGNEAAAARGRAFRVVNPPEGGGSILENFELSVEY